MDVKMFLEFPGILVLIGIGLLILAIIIGVVAYKKPKKDESGDATIFGGNEIYNVSNEEANINNMSGDNSYSFFNNNLENNTQPNEIPNNTENPLNYTEMSTDNVSNTDNQTMFSDYNNNFNNMVDNSTIIEPTNEIEEKQETTVNENVETVTDTSAIDNNMSLEAEPSVEVEPSVKEFNTGVFNVEDFKIKNEQEDNPPLENSNEIKDEYNISNDNDSKGNEEIKEVPNNVNIATITTIEEEPKQKSEENSVIFSDSDESPELTIDSIIASQTEVDKPKEEIEQIKPILEDTIKEFKQPEIVIPEEKEIYGGVKPLENVTLDFNENVKHDAYSNPNFSPTGNIVTPLNDKTPITTTIVPNNVSNENKPVANEEKSDEVELL